MRKRARFAAVSAILLLGLSPAFWPGFASADAGLKIAGFVDVPGSTLNLPLAHGDAPVTIQVKLGIPAVQIPIQITSSTAVVSETGREVTLTDGDRVKIKGMIVDNVIRATKLELEEFPEIEVRGTASSLPPAGGVTLPVPSGATIDVTVTLVPGVDVTVVLTEHTKVEGRHTLANGDIIRIDAVLKDTQLVATEISVEG
jgi:hypothetical protein